MIPMFAPMADIIYAHHEKYDGSGYPNGLKDNEINELAKIMIVADAFDAMTTSRIYKARKSVEIAIEELLALSERHFNPQVVKSAVKVLKSVEIDENINQLPHTKLEEERFSYFYNDSISQAYNQSYLELILMKNYYENRFKFMALFSISNFSIYNKKYSWSDGDKLLREFANTLVTHFDESLVFRVFGDDFVVINDKKVDVGGVVKVLDKLFEEGIVSYSIKFIDLESLDVITLQDIEKIQQGKSLS